MCSRPGRAAAIPGRSPTVNERALRALICEDEGLTVILLRRALTTAGYEVVGEAAEGASGIEMARTLEPDFILMDVNMPGVNGIDATRQIMQERPMPIVILTAYSDDRLVEEAIEAGACAYIVKPIVSEQLIPAVRTALTRFEALQSIQQENQDLKEQLETRKLVERAKGILMDRARLSEADAFRRLQKTSRDRCQTLKHTALEIIHADSLL
ncbi:MAG: response regulator [Chthonomonadales bacterium]|nr:response regulator [Chthonomonadales bacterium]